MSRGRAIAAVLGAGIAIVLISATIGTQLYAGHRPELWSFALVHFAGYLFFLLMPVEALVPLYQVEGYGGTTLVLIAVATAIAAQAIDYGIGRAVSDQVLHDLVGRDRFERFKRLIGRWGGWAILLFNLTPLSSPNMLLVAGITRYSPRRAFVLSTIGLTVKYVGIVYVVDLFALFGVGVA